MSGPKSILVLWHIIKKKNPSPKNIRTGIKNVVGPLGLEPRITAPKTGVLPLHHGPIP